MSIKKTIANQAKQHQESRHQESRHKVYLDDAAYVEDAVAVLDLDTILAQGLPKIDPQVLINSTQELAESQLLPAIAQAQARLKQQPAAAYLHAELALLLARARRFDELIPIANQAIPANFSAGYPQLACAVFHATPRIRRQLDLDIATLDQLDQRLLISGHYFVAAEAAFMSLMRTRASDDKVRARLLSIARLARQSGITYDAMKIERWFLQLFPDAPEADQVRAQLNADEAQCDVVTTAVAAVPSCEEEEESIPLFRSSENNFTAELPLLPEAYLAAAPTSEAEVFARQAMLQPPTWGNALLLAKSRHSMHAHNPYIVAELALLLIRVERYQGRAGLIAHAITSNLHHGNQLLASAIYQAAEAISDQFNFSAAERQLLEQQHPLELDLNIGDD